MAEEQGRPSQSSHRKIIQPRAVLFSDLKEALPGLEELFEAQSWIPFLTLHTKFYPDLVREFFRNLSLERGRLSSTVKGKSFFITPSFISRTFDCPSSGHVLSEYEENTQDIFQKMTGRAPDLDEDVSFRALNANIFPPLQRVMHHMFTTLIVPKAGSHQFVSNIHRFLFHHILGKSPVSLPIIFFDQLKICLKEKKRGFPYACHLTGIFKAVGIELRGEKSKSLSSRNFYSLSNITKYMKYELQGATLSRNLPVAHLSDGESSSENSQSLHGQEETAATDRFFPEEQTRVPSPDPIPAPQETQETATLPNIFLAALNSVNERLHQIEDRLDSQLAKLNEVDQQLHHVQLFQQQHVVEMRKSFFTMKVKNEKLEETIQGLHQRFSDVLATSQHLPKPSQGMEQQTPSSSTSSSSSSSSSSSPSPPPHPAPVASPMLPEDNQGMDPAEKEDEAPAASPDLPENDQGMDHTENEGEAPAPEEPAPEEQPEETMSAVSPQACESQSQPVQTQSAASPPLAQPSSLSQPILTASSPQACTLTQSVQSPPLASQPQDQPPTAVEETPLIPIISISSSSSSDGTRRPPSPVGSPSATSKKSSKLKSKHLVKKRKRLHQSPSPSVPPQDPATFSRRKIQMKKPKAPPRRTHSSTQPKEKEQVPEFIRPLHILLPGQPFPRPRPPPPPRQFRSPPPRRSRGRRAFSFPGGRVHTPIRCYSCHLYGHVAAQCPRRPPPSREPSIEEMMNFFDEVMGGSQGASSSGVKKSD